MEQFTLYCIIKSAIEKGYTKIIGEYIPTAKNIIVKDHYASLGFEPINNKWVLDINENNQANVSHIKTK